jgi:hypothetical protein
VTGQVFTSLEKAKEDQLPDVCVDLKNAEWNTADLAEGNDLGLQTDDYVHVVITVTGSMEGGNVFAGSVAAIAVELPSTPSKYDTNSSPSSGTDPASLPR